MVMFHGTNCKLSPHCQLQYCLLYAVLHCIPTLIYGVGVSENSLCVLQHNWFVFHCFQANSLFAFWRSSNNLIFYSFLDPVERPSHKSMRNLLQTNVKAWIMFCWMICDWNQAWAFVRFLWEASAFHWDTVTFHRFSVFQPCDSRSAAVTAPVNQAQVRSHGGIRGQCSPKNFCAPQILLCPENFVLNI